MSFSFKRKVGLALGGGAAKGIAHLGVLKILYENNLKPYLVVGTSIGALIGAAYSAGNFKNITQLIENFYKIQYLPEFKSIEKIFLSFKTHKPKKFVEKIKFGLKKIFVYEKLFKEKFLISAEQFQKLLKKILPDINIEDMPTKFGAVSLDLISKKPVLHTKGSLIKSVMASCAIPGIFEPVKYNEKLLVDGGWIEKVPVISSKKMGAKKVLAVDVSPYTKSRTKFKNGVQILIHADEITNNELKEIQLSYADLIISINFPKDEWTDFYKFNEFVKLGEIATSEKLPKIKNLFRRFLFF